MGHVALINVAKSTLKILESAALTGHQVQKLKDPVDKIRQILEESEQKLSSEDSVTRNWVKMVNSAVYEADDLVDEAATYVASSSNPLCMNFSILGVRMGPKINKICEELTQLAHSAAILPNPHVNEVDIESMPYPAVTEARPAIGRESEKKRIVDALLDTSDLKKDISVVAIVGIGGIGKTLLAQLVYNDARVTDQFDLKLWVCVTDDFDIKALVRKIVQNCSPSTSAINSLSFDQLIRLLVAAIRDKIYLLVLDDVWNENRENWLQLKSLLRVGARGSRILVTTRSSYVAEVIMEVTWKLELPSLSFEASWDLFKRLAFDQREPPENLVHIAHEILKKCAGVPLAIKAIASLLYGQSEDKWEVISAKMFSQQQTVDSYGIMHALMLSYNHLPSPLKPCFAYLSLFPQDFEFHILDVVSHWQAQGFLGIGTYGDDMEELAEDYLRELAWRSFITDIASDKYGNSATFKIHGLIRDLACHIAAGWKQIHMSEMLREKLMVDRDKLRTFVRWIEPEYDDRIMEFTDKMKFSNFNKLRVLDLHSFGIQRLSSSVGNMIHLRYLDLSHNESLVKLPNSITNLYNLQTLKLNFCYELKALPANTSKLVRLRRLEIDGCENLTFIPTAFEKLSSLRILSRYVVGKPRFTSASGFKSLGNLNNLQGRLMIDFSENWIAAVNEATKSNLSSKTRLTQLVIKWEPDRCTSNIDSVQSKLLESLQPPVTLKMLQIEGYRGHEFPSWASAESLIKALPFLVTVSVDGCGKSKAVPPFSRLKLLKHLTLRFMDNVEFFEISDSQSHSLTSETPFFPSLQELTLHGLYSLEGWWKDETPAPSPSFNCLQKLKVWSCPKLTCMPLFPSVKVLDLQNINKKLLDDPNAWMRELPSSSNSQFSKPGGHLQNLPLLRTLHLKDCLNLNTLELGKSSGNLEKLVVERLDMLTSLTEDLKLLTSLEELEVASCKQLDLSGGCQGSCGECDVCHMPWKSLVKLRRLTLRELPKLVTLPFGLRFITTLKVLCISGCHNFSVLPQWINELTELQHLRLEGIPALTMLPDGLKVLHSLVKVDIIECPKLMERCREGGEDWDKIKHARVLCHKSWRYALMTEADLQQKPKIHGKNVVVHSCGCYCETPLTNNM